MIINVLRKVIPQYIQIYVCSLRRTNKFMALLEM